MYSYRPPLMAGQKQDDQHEHTFSNYVRIRDVALKSYQRRWTIGKSGERGSGISVLVVRHDDDIYIYIYIQHLFICKYAAREPAYFFSASVQVNHVYSCVLAILSIQINENTYKHPPHTYIYIYIYIYIYREREREREREKYIRFLK